jgi:PEGA domain-containing protein
MTARRRDRLARALALSFAFALAVPAEALAQQPPKPPAGVDEAREHYDRGLQLYRDGAFDGAITEFQRAYELAPSFKLFYFIGLTHRQLNDFASALRAFEQYVKDGGREVPAKRRAEVEREIAQLRKRVGRLEVVANEAGAAVLVDDRVVGTSPLEAPVVVNVGQHKVVAVKEGRQSPPATVAVAGDESTHVDLQVPPPAVVQVPVTVSEENGVRKLTPVPNAPPPERHVPWVAWGITGALAVGAGVTGVLALSSSGSLQDERDTPTSRSALDRDERRTAGFAIATDVLAVGALVAGGVSLYLTLKPRPAAVGVAPRPQLRFGAGPGSVALGGTF